MQKKLHLYAIILSVLLLSPPTFADDATKCAQLYEAELYKYAFSSCKIAAEQGDANAQNTLGWIYENIASVSQNKPDRTDKEKAVIWYRLAAERGHVSAQFNLGRMYYYGIGVSIDKQEAAKWFRVSADQGHSESQYFLGQAYRKGDGVSLNMREAIKWYRLAADQGHNFAQHDLGVWYATGQGVLKDRKEAYIWFMLAAINGNENSIKARDQVEKFLTKSAIESAVQEAKRRLVKIDSRSYNR